jgi:hypothetical protein
LVELPGLVLGDEPAAAQRRALEADVAAGRRTALSRRASSSLNIVSDMPSGSVMPRLMATSSSQRGWAWRNAGSRRIARISASRLQRSEHAMNTRTIAIIALVIAVIVLIILLT